MKLTGLMLCWLMTFAAAAQTNQGWKVCRNPVRVFARQGSVNLTPLYQWWLRQPLSATDRTEPAETNTAATPVDARPLAAWRRVTGTKVGELGESWIVDAVIYTSPTVATNARIFLNHPPTVEAETFASLQTQLEQVVEAIGSLRSAYAADTNAAAQAEQRAKGYSHSRWKFREVGVRNYSALATRDKLAAASARNQLSQLEAARKELEQQLNTIPSAEGAYRIDWFAVLLGNSRQGLPIYDLGLVSATPP